MPTTAYPEAARYYSLVAAQTATQPRAICLLHERCVQFVSLALDKPLSRREYIVRAQNILSQLEMALVRDDPLAESLFLLYDYAYICLEKGAEDTLVNAGKILAMLRDTFRMLAMRPRPQIKI